MMVWARVTEEERRIIDKLADAMHMTISEFVRYTILQELERRSLITTKIELIKEEIREPKAARI